MSGKQKHQHTAQNQSPEEDVEASGRALVRLPGFVNDEAIGLGDVLKAVTSAAGIKPCGACQKRAATLNRLISFTGKNRKR